MLINVSMASSVLAIALLCGGCSQPSALPKDEATQRLLAAEVERVVDSEIAEDILEKHYDPKTLDALYCVYKQTHQRNPDNGTVLVLYARVLCAKSAPGANPKDRQNKDLTHLITLPLRIEVEAKDNDFEVVAWQFPRGVATYTEDVARMFPSKLLPEINSTAMGVEFFDQIREKANGDYANH